MASNAVKENFIAVPYSYIPFNKPLYDLHRFHHKRLLILPTR